LTSTDLVSKFIEIMRNHRCRLTIEERSVLEKIPLPLAMYQYVDQHVETILVSDGLCDFTGNSRDDLMRHYNNGMFSSVHPDDKKMLADLGYRFATQGGAYDVVYRTRLGTQSGYRIVHCTGKYDTTRDGSRVAFVFYTDVTGLAEPHTNRKPEKDAPELHLLYESLGPLAVISRKNKILFYYNKALCRMLPPAAEYDSGITFDHFFYGDLSHGIPELFDAPDSGPVLVQEPRSGRQLEISAVSSIWNGEPAYVITFSEQETEQHRRIAFNTFCFSGATNGTVPSEMSYKGFFVWNITQDSPLVLECGVVHNQDFLNSGFDGYLKRIAARCTRSDDTAFLLSHGRDFFLAVNNPSAVHGQRIFGIETDGKIIQIQSEFFLMRSPDTNELYIKITETNVTESVIMNTLLIQTLEQQNEYVACFDFQADTVRIVFNTNCEGDRSLQTFPLGDFVSGDNSMLIQQLYFAQECPTRDTLHRYFSEHCQPSGSVTFTVDTPGSRTKSLTIQSLDIRSSSYFVTCSDVSEVLRGERERYEQLKNTIEKEQRRVKQLLQLSYNDQLTRLPNRRSFLAKFRAEIARMRRDHSSAFLALGDIDSFKVINDTWGHPAGDAVLQSVAAVFFESVRKTDIVARWGGEEFIFFLAEENEHDAYLTLDRIRKRIELLQISWETSYLRCSMSFGLSEVIVDAGSVLKNAYTAADIALYQAKATGKNCIIIG
jgi:diguanylate cyclase (GGDEF)-like protein